MSVLRYGRSTWVFDPAPVVIGTGAVVGEKEGLGPLGGDMDVIHKDPYLGQKSFEAAEQKLQEEACNLAVRHSGLGRDEVDLHFSGDLLNQITGSSFTARELAIPYLGLFGACSTAVEALSLGALAVASGAAGAVLCSTASHTNTAEKQFRYPNEYGAQKNGTTQITVTGAGAFVLGEGGTGPYVTSATIGRVVDLNVTDVFNMGAAMAPAACDCLLRHIRERGVRPDYYDLILTGDLGKVGSSLLLELLEAEGVFLPQGLHKDAGKLIFGLGGTAGSCKKLKTVKKLKTLAQFAGGSGCGCMAVVAAGHVRRQMCRGNLKRVLLIATGALLSPLSVQQQESIPGIAHAVSWEVM